MPGPLCFYLAGNRSRAARLGLIVCALAAGCTPLPTPQAGLQLAQAQMSADSVVFDIYFIRVPLDEPLAADELWSSIDEQRIDPGLRGRLFANGLRVGVVSGTLPEALERWMQLSDVPQDRRDMQQQVDLEAQPLVSQRHAQVRRGQRLDIVASDVHDSLPLLRAERDGVRGQTYHAAQCLIRLVCEPHDDGTVAVDLLPQIQHGEAQQRWTGSDGVLRLDPGRPTLELDDLRLKFELSAGQMILAACLPDRPGSLGQHFFAKGPEQKLLLIRLAQVQSIDGELLPTTGEACATSGDAAAPAENVAPVDAKAPAADSPPPISATAIVEEPLLEEPLVEP